MIKDTKSACPHGKLKLKAVSDTDGMYVVVLISLNKPTPRALLNTSWCSGCLTVILLLSSSSSR